MATTILDPQLSRELIAERRARGLDRWDEVWDGDYVVMTQPNDEHQELVAGWTSILYEVVQRANRGKVRPGVNVSDRRRNWRRNYRCPDVVVYLNENPAENHDVFWYGGPDLAVEVLSPGDRTREKLGFYARVGTREVLLVDRDPWSLELYRLEGEVMRLVGRSTPERSDWLESQVTPLKFRLVPGEPRPRIEVLHTHSAAAWTI
jgi:Uma2 family endonuclease